MSSTDASSLALATVVIPCRNQARFLSDAIESALRQTWPAVEVIVVDDGSTDDTASVVSRYAAVRHLTQTNQGTAVARNAGLAASRGEFVLFLDADDRLLPHAVTTGIDWLRDHPDRAYVTGHVRLIRQDGADAGIPQQEHADGYVPLLRSNYIWTPGVVIYRRLVLDCVGGFARAACGSADYELNIRIARRLPFGCHHAVVLEYRQHSANMSADVAHMLASAVSVRRAQRRYVVHDADARRAWRDGLSIVQEDYGRRLIEQVKADLRTRGRRVHAVRNLVCLCRYYPTGLVKELKTSWCLESQSMAKQ